MELFCPVCREDYDTKGELVPKALPCFHHSVCLACLRRLCDGNRIKCSTCRTEGQVPQPGGPEAFPTNTYIVPLIEMRAKMKLEQPPAPQPATAEAATASAPLAPLCLRHGKPCVMLCKNLFCRVLLCASCSLKEHNRVGLTENSADGLELSQKKNSTTSQMQDLRAFDNRLTELTENIDEKTAQAKRAIDEKVVEVIQPMLTQGESLKQRVTDVKDEEIAKLRALKEEIHSCQEKAGQFLQQIEAVLEGSVLESLQAVQTLLQTGDEFNTSKPKKRPDEVRVRCLQFTPKTLTPWAGKIGFLE